MSYRVLMRRGPRIEILGADSAQARFEAATNYALGEITHRLLVAVQNPLDFTTKTEVAPYRADLDRVVNKWKAASSDADRLAVAKEAESLANRVQETMPGARIQGWTRTNLESGEVPKVTPPASFTKEVKETAAEQWDKGATWVKDKFKMPWWGYALIGTGIVVVLGFAVAPIILPILTARAGRSTVIVGNTGGHPTRRRLWGQK